MFKERRAIDEKRVKVALKHIRRVIYDAKAPLRIAAWHVHGEPVPLEAAMRAEYQPFEVGGRWGGLWDTTWFRFQGEVPSAWAGREVVALVRLTDFEYEGFTAEGLVFRCGCLELALNANRSEVRVANPAQGGEAFEFLVEAAANGGADANGFIEGMCLPDYRGQPRYALAQAELACVNRAASDYYYDFKVLQETQEVLPESSQRRAEICRALSVSLNAFEAGNLREAKAALREMLGRRNGCTVHTISGVGHAHIDTAWLWPLREAMRKCARTFSTALDYMEEYPEYVFACSQPQQYAWMKVHYPEIWKKIVAAVKRGQWEPVGSMWVEPDCNLPSGESLVRQLLYGKRFFLQEFGVDTRDVWLPDVFGYPATLPQVFREAGVEFFMTQKISWNQFNTFPHHTFWWEGIDGSRVFTHFPPSATYSADTGPGDLSKTVSLFREHGTLSRSLLLYGFGDGGGGPTIEMLEKARRLRDLEGLPKLELEKAISFFEKASSEAEQLPVWYGELYLELHRGTFTTHADIKRSNRLAERLLREAEFWVATARLLNPGALEIAAEPPRAVYDVTGLDEGASSGVWGAALERAWKLVLLNQFHDIIPGSSIHWVYEDSRRDFEAIQELAASVRDSARMAVVGSIDTRGWEEPLLAVNPLSFDRAEVVQAPGGQLVWVEVPAFGYAVIEGAAKSEESFCGPPVSVKEADGEITVENGLLRFVINREGSLSAVTDLVRNHEVLSPGEEGNVFHLHHDVPTRFDAWEMEPHLRDAFELVGAAESVRVAESTPCRSVVEVVRTVGRSQMIQRLILRAGSPRLDFVTVVDWREDNRCLRVLFPVQVRTERATYDIPFGHVTRPTHANTSWDMAQFEVCAHTWADLSECGFGVALLNDCKYGHAIHGNSISLTLLRAPCSPDPQADRGIHHFTYSLLPHGGDFRTGSVLEEAAALNCPLEFHPLATGKGTLPPDHSFLRCDSPHLKIDAWKVAEEGDAFIVRLHEAHGARGRARLHLGFDAGRVWRTDLIERATGPSEIEGREILFDYGPFQILTFKIEPTSLDVASIS